jgi:hypothetical protein
MDRSVSAALLSAFVFPGAGHLFLRRAARGCLFLLPALLAVVYFVGQVMSRASAIADQILAGTVPLDPALIAAQLESQGDSGSPLMTLSVVVMIVCWAGSIVDSFLIGRARKA